MSYGFNPNNSRITQKTASSFIDAELEEDVMIVRFILISHR